MQYNHVNKTQKKNFDWHSTEHMPRKDKVNIRLIWVVATWKEPAGCRSHNSKASEAPTPDRPTCFSVGSSCLSWNSKAFNSYIRLTSSWMTLMLSFVRDWKASEQHTPKSIHGVVLLDLTVLPFCPTNHLNCYAKTLEKVWKISVTFIQEDKCSRGQHARKRWSSWAVTRNILDILLINMPMLENAYQHQITVLQEAHGSHHHYLNKVWWSDGHGCL